VSQGQCRYDLAGRDLVAVDLAAGQVMDIWRFGQRGYEAPGAGASRQYSIAVMGCISTLLLAKYAHRRSGIRGIRLVFTSNRSHPGDAYPATEKSLA